MADSDGSAPGPAGVAQMNIRNKFAVAVCIAFMALLPTIEGATGAGIKDASKEATVTHLMRLHNLRGMGLRHQAGAKTSNTVHLLELHIDQTEAKESDSPAEDHGIHDDSAASPTFASHLAQHIRNLREAPATTLTGEVKTYRGLSRALLYMNIIDVTERYPFI